MKKLVMTAAVVACAGIVSAQVYSANVVGYAKIATPAAGGFDIVSATQFGTNDTINIQNLFSNLTDLHAGTSVATKPNADKLYVWDGNTYATYGLYYKSSTSQTFWLLLSSPGWGVAALANPANVSIARGDSVWFQTGAGGASVDALTAGEVPNDGTYNIDLAGSFTMISFPYTAAVNLNGLAVSNGASGSTVASKPNVDKIYLWDGNTYATYGLYYKVSTSQTFWLLLSSPGWGVAALANPANVEIGIGQGFWYEAPAGAKTIGFTQNYSL